MAAECSFDFSIRSRFFFFVLFMTPTFRCTSDELPGNKMERASPKAIICNRSVSVTSGHAGATVSDRKILDWNSR